MEICFFSWTLGWRSTVSNVCLVHPQQWDGLGCLVDHQFKCTTWLPWHHGSVACPVVTCPVPAQLVQLLRASQRPLKATYPPCYWHRHLGGHKVLKGHVCDTGLSLEVGYNRFPPLLHRGIAFVHRSVLRAVLSQMFPCCWLSAAVAQPHPMWA